MTGYLDVLLHFALECTISGAGRLQEARFQARVALGLERRITYLRKSKSMAEDLSWRGARRPLKKKKCETCGKEKSLIEKIHYRSRSQRA